jgi:hypothetical protein
MMAIVCNLIVAVALLVVPMAGPETPEVDWFNYSMSAHAFRWQTFEEIMVRGFSVEFAPNRQQGLVADPPVSLWSSGYIFAQHPGTLGGAQYEMSAPRGARVHRAVLCTWYDTWWRCDLSPAAAK